MPTVRRRQRLSSSCTAPAERSPAISSRATSLRISTGRLIAASASRAPDLKVKGASPSGRPLRSIASTTPLSAPPACARSTLTVSAPAALSAAASAWAGARPPSTTVSGWLPMTCLKPATKSAPLPRSTPSESHTTSTFGADLRKRSISGSDAVRSTLNGFGFNCFSCTRAALAVIMEMSRSLSDSGRSATPRLSASARATISSAVRRRSSQDAAAGQPSSIMTSNGAARLDEATGGFHNGPAAAMMTSAASVSRSSISHHGVRDGVSSFGAISNSSRVGGKSMMRGRGGISRSRHHSTGSASRPSSTSGSAKARGRPAIMRLLRSRCAPAAGSS